MTDLQVSKALGISVPTVRTHLARLFEKLDVDGRTGLILRLVWTFRQECRKLGCPRRR
jgi:DNA-binding CsgD family transcriptional regulator